MRRFSLATSLLFVCPLLLVAHRPAQAQISVNGVLAIPADDSVFSDDEDDVSVKGNARSPGGQMARRLQLTIDRGMTPQRFGRDRGHENGGNHHDGDRGLDKQVNNPALDHVVTFDPSVVVTRPFEFSTQSETSMVSNGRHIVVGYNSSANSVVEFFPGFGLFFTQLLFSGFSTSHDGGRTWTSGFVPPVSSDAPFTFGDPSLAMDRRGAIY